MSSAICFNLDQSKILSSVNGLMVKLFNKPQADYKLNIVQLTLSQTANFRPFQFQRLCRR